MSKKTFDVEKEIKKLKRSIRDLEREKSYLWNSFRELEKYIRDGIQENRKEMEAFEPVYRHYKVRPKPSTMKADEHNRLVEGKEKSPVQPRSQMEFDTWRYEALVEKHEKYLKRKKKNDQVG